MIKCALDCDPGHDDAIMIMLAVYHPKLSVQYISTTHGNQTVNKTYLNARRILTLIHRADTIPVYKGYSRPLIRESIACPEIHGESGLAGVDWEKIDKKMPKNPALNIMNYTDESELKPNDFFLHLHKLISQLDENEKFYIISTGSQTNTAQYLLAYPDDAKKIIFTCMAGNFTIVGNIMPFSEFNVMIDPESTNFILNSGVEYFFAAPLDITHTVLITDEIMEKIRNNIKKYSNEFAEIIENLLMFFKDSYKEVFNFNFPPLHDPVAAFHVIEPDVFEHENCHVDVETKGEFTYGCCCSDLIYKKKGFNKYFAGKKNNAVVSLKLKEGGLDKFWNTLIDVFVDIAKEIKNKEENSK